MQTRRIGIPRTVQKTIKPLVNQAQYGLRLGSRSHVFFPRRRHEQDFTVKIREIFGQAQCRAVPWILIELTSQ